MLKRILVGLGAESYSEAATRYAVELAQAHGSELLGVAILDRERLEDVGPTPIGVGSVIQELREHRVHEARQRIDESLARFRASCAAAGAPQRTRCEEGDPVTWIAQLSRYEDLCIGGLQSMFELGVVDEPPDALVRLISEGVRPILAVGKEYRSIRRVLIAYSGSMESAKTMRRFVQMRLWQNLTTRIVTFDKAPGEAAELLEAAADYCRAHGLEPTTEHVAAAPEGRLLAYAADWQADLIVTGNSAKSLLRRRIFGETALELIRHSPIPLFLAQ